MLKFEITESGTVTKIMVEKSAGHEDLDRAAIAAVQRWRFEPARRGAQAVAVWVTLPVRFELRH
jgi:protein TonB